MNDSPGHWPPEKNDSPPPTYFVISQRGDLDFSGGLQSKSTWIPHNSRLPLLCTLSLACCGLFYYWKSAHVLKPEEHSETTLQDDCVTDSSDYKPHSSFTSLGLFKFGAHASGIINLNNYDSAYLYTNKVRLRNFLWTISVMCSYFVPPACCKWLYKINNYIIAVPYNW